MVLGSLQEEQPVSYLEEIATYPTAIFLIVIIFDPEGGIWVLWSQPKQQHDSNNNKSVCSSASAIQFFPSTRHLER